MGSEDDVTTSPPPTSETGSGGGGGGRFRHTSFLKWRQNNKSDVSGMNVDGEFKKWPHPPEALHKGKVTYVVKVSLEKCVTARGAAHGKSHICCESKFREKLML